MLKSLLFPVLFLTFTLISSIYSRLIVNTIILIICDYALLINLLLNSTYKKNQKLEITNMKIATNNFEEKKLFSERVNNLTLINHISQNYQSAIKNNLEKNNELL